MSWFLGKIFLIIQSYSPGGANSRRTGELCWALPRISSLLY